MIRIQDVTFYYNEPDEASGHAGLRPALSKVSLDIQPGEFVALLGRNGSGKSSLSRLLNGIELPTEGTVTVDGRRTAEPHEVQEIRRAVQIVFQNPENQQVGLTVGEDIAFGLSNIGWPQQEIRSRIAWALQLVGLEADEERPVTRLSGGEKQKLALASVLALAPRYLILDEATSMLDPVARRRFVETLHEVRQRVPFTLIYITHHLEEVMGADRWVLFREGRIVTSGPPSGLQKDTQLLHDCGLELPYYYKLAELLRRSGIPAPATLSEQELRGLLCRSS
ncbi:ATP-binding cassette domain-containing protein [Paenibacillus riograndensis]|uniref:Energy-coupling factor transporter ATP-binding protein EcfA n=1 Tax=Paenibacillus riograndensis SBR5 TaxID=1073571 RepID=A0A0E3WIN6_9BACL|nr:ATP-binding cassette domain-containing protein [Paenibacillus riograndensis]CQR57353.1 Energy-coupling factor transporter ATP-binding protein EcfA [Paenibacillus riograndensis SBR5]